jgi:hypothetical protein
MNDYTEGERRVKRELKMQVGNGALHTVGYFERPDEIPNLLRQIADVWEEELRELIEREQ